ncbi:MAG: OmpA family protein [Myxococcota bacterium]
MSILLVLLATAQARNLWGSYDADDDGVRDRDDACVRIPETRNGYLDDDGCPDSLSGITVAGSFGTMIEENAKVVIEGPGFRKVGTNQVRVDDLVPGTEVTAVVALGCQAAQTRLVIEPVHRKVRLKLQPALFSEVTFVVRDSLGETPRNAKITWLGSEPAGCSPAEDTELAAGFGKLLLGRGTHTVLVRTPDGSRNRMEIVVGDTPSEVFVDMPVPGGRDANGGRMLADTVYFGDDADTLDDAGMATVKTVAAYLNQHTEYSRVTVEGHADERAWGPYNDELSERRADAVADALIAAGVQADRVQTIGRGEKEPAERGHTAAAHAKNRRVHFIVGK